MIGEFTIKNYKSIVEERVDLGPFNVFIGPNGSGKTNVLEALAMAAATLSSRLSVEDLLLRGIRPTRPAITLSAFSDPNPDTNIHLTFASDLVEDEKATFTLTIQAPGGAAAPWTAQRQVRPGPKMFARIREYMKQQNEEMQRLAPEERAQRLINRSVDDPLDISRVLLGYGIYAAETPALRGLGTSSHREPIGLRGENLDVFLASLGRDEPEAYRLVVEKAHLISWFDGIVIDETDALKVQGHKLSQSTSRLYLRDRHLANRANVLAAENANEGILHLLFYLSLFASKSTPEVFAIDNIETGLNPKLCTKLVEELAGMAKANSKQALVVTHSPAVLDGLNLHDDDERLFEVFRDDDGHTRVKRIKLKPDATVGNKRLKLSELWMRGHLGGVPTNF